MIRNMTKIFLTEEDRDIDVDAFLDNASEEDVFIFRRRLEEARLEKPIALCSVCYQPVVLRGDINRSFFFAHTKNSDDCPIKTTTNLTHDEILAMKFNGQKEGKAHRENKFKLADLLKQDDFFSNDVLIESTFRETNSSGIAKHWRKPDVSAVSANGEYSIVFELQVSTTFIEVIVSRERFYRENNAYIMWVFLDFDCEKFTTLDVGYSNRSNVFVFDEEAKNLSLDSQKLVLRCYYKKPFMTSSLSISYEWDCQFVDFNDLSFDSDEKKIYFADSDYLKNQVLGEIKSAKEKLENDRIAREKIIAANRQKELERRFQTERGKAVANVRSKNYPSKRNKIDYIAFVHSTSKSFGDSVKCSQCGKIVKRKKIGRSYLCSNCYCVLE
ncbi:hypothetical protein CJB45_001745 [Salmonella enterica]|nr:hypothetical protein [Salmonella enterica]